MSKSVSAFMLERYRIGEVKPSEKLLVDEALAKDSAIADELRQLEYADNDFWKRFPPELFMAKIQGNNIKKDSNIRYFKPMPQAVWFACAAALALMVFLPVYLTRSPFHADTTDRIKGPAVKLNAELCVFLDGNGKSIMLGDRAVIHEGSTIQLAYRVANSSKQKYGMIFSVDGRAAVTLHYPHRSGQSTQLISGDLIPLNEAYTLDDAPGYEIFYFLIADKPIEVRNIMYAANLLAIQVQENPGDALKKGTAVFRDYEIRVLTLLKE